MGYKEKDSKLFTEFPPVTTKEWEEKIAEDLKGGDYFKKLLWDTGEGFMVKPYYRSEDLENIACLNALPEYSNENYNDNASPPEFYNTFC